VEALLFKFLRNLRGLVDLFLGIQLVLLIEEGLSVRKGFDHETHHHSTRQFLVTGARSRARARIQIVLATIYPAWPFLSSQFPEDTEVDGIPFLALVVLPFFCLKIHRPFFEHAVLENPLEAFASDGT
jgi:hypothetical protein